MFFGAKTNLFDYIFFYQTKNERTKFAVVSSSSPTTPTSTVGSVTSSSSQPPSSSFAAATSNNQAHNSRDEIYIDDEGLEGSGGRGEVSIYTLHIFHIFTKFSFTLSQVCHIVCYGFTYKYKLINV